jgi:hypothetical protein
MSDMDRTDETTLEFSDATSQEESSRSFCALKCYFYTPKRGDIRGAFCFVFSEDGTILDEVFWATREMNGIDIDIMAGWRTLNKSIPVMGAYEKSLVEKLSSVTFDILSTSVRAELLQSSNVSEELENLSGELRNAFERATHYFLEIELRFERLSYHDLLESGVVSTNEEKEKETDASSDPQAEGEKSFPGTLVTCLPVIDPVRGKPVSELVPGDLVNVKIQGGVGAAELIQKYLISTSQEAVFPVETVEKKDDDKTYVLLNISEEIHGLIVVTKDLRLSVVQRASIKRRVISFNADNIIFFGTLTIATIVILIAVRLLFF